MPTRSWWVLVTLLSACGGSTAPPLRWSATPSASPSAPDIVVLISQWSFEVDYGDGAREPDLRLPSGRATTLELRSFDVDHRFVIEGTDVSVEVPSRTSVTIRVEPLVVGELATRCEIHCPTDPSVAFRLPIHVLSAADYDAWSASRRAPPTDRTAAVWGQELFASLACTACHGAGVAHDLRNLRGTDRTFTDGSSLHLDDAAFDAYVRESVLDPSARLTGPPIMPVISMSPAQLDALVAYLRCRSDDCGQRAECAGACE